MKVGPIACCLQVDKTRAQSKEWDFISKCSKAVRLYQTGRETAIHQVASQAQVESFSNLGAEVGHGVKI